MAKNTEKKEGKPFIKWAGGKGQLIDVLDRNLPNDFKECDTYVEPFIGGGAFLFHILQKYPNIKNVVINDINKDLINCYKTIKDNPRLLLDELYRVENEYKSLHDINRKQYFLNIRSIYNEKKWIPVINSTFFIFLNRTCFNGLYRVNKKGLFNTPFGGYANPNITNEEVIMKDSELLQKVTILNGNYDNTFDYIKGKAFFYLDPPYRPLTNTSSFSSYNKDGFNDEEQIKLKEFCDKLNKNGHYFMQSNSDSRNCDGNKEFFDDLYKDYKIERILAKRNINSDGEKRGKLTELLIKNY